MNEQDITRAKILGVLIRDARVYADRSIEDCASAIGIPADDFARAEAGDYIVSLPELEVLALYLNVPMAHFWGSQTLGKIQKPDYKQLLGIRHKIVGGLLRQARMASGISVEELANTATIPTSRLQAYEMGHAAVPLLELERLATALSVPLDYFIDNQRGPLGRHETAQKRRKHFEELPTEIQDFVSTPINISYLETAKRLSELDVFQLRRIAEGILDITF